MRIQLLNNIRIWSAFLLIIESSYHLFAQNIIVAGVVSSQKNDLIRVCFNYNRSEFEKFEVDENNNFLFSFSPKRFYNFVRIENNEILLHPGDSVFISLQGDSIVGISGGNAMLNLSLVNLQQSQSGLWKSASEDSFADFLVKLTQWYNAKLQQVNVCKYVNGNMDRDLALSFLNFEVAAISYGYLTGITGRKDTIQYAEAIHSNEFNRYTKLKDFNDTVVGQSLPYCLALQFYLMTQMNIAYDQNKSYLQNLWGHIVALNLPNSNIDVAYCLISPNFLQAGYTYYDHFFHDADSLLYYFSLNANEKRNADYLKNEFERQYGYLRPGRQIKEVEVTDTFGEKYLLSGFKDKIIYVKMWSLTCKGCIETISEYNELLATFKDTNVVFISVAMNQHKYVEQWKSIIRSHDLKGLNFISENGLYLGNYGLPKYYIIGKGNLIVNLNAPKPGSPRLKPMLENLIKEERNNE